MTGTFTFTSTVAVAAIALRGLNNERGEFLISTLPVIDLNAASGGAGLVFPHYADGAGWTTQIVLANPTDSALMGTVRFLDPSGGPATVLIGNEARSSFAYSIPPRGFQKLQTSGIATAAASVRVVPATNTPPPFGVSILSFRNEGTTVSEAAVPAVASAGGFRFYAQMSGDFRTNGIGSIQTGVAVTNTSAAAASVSLELFRLDGSSTGLVGTLSVPPGGQVATFLHQIPEFAKLQTPFQGTLRASSSAAISVVGLRGRYNERRDFLVTTTPSTNEAAPPLTSPLVFPHVVDSGGYTTQFILLNTRTGQQSSGKLLLSGQSGTPMNVLMR
jgi:hypothetical protein